MPGRRAGSGQARHYGAGRFRNASWTNAAIHANPRQDGHAEARSLHLSGEWSTDNRPPGYRVKITSTDPDNASVYTDEIQRGEPERYTVSYDVWNHRDSPSFAQIVFTAA